MKLHEADKKFFGFELPDKNGEQEYYRYLFTVMASPAVEVITRLLRSVKAHLHQLGIKLSFYVDDGRVSTSTKEKTWSHFQFVQFSAAGISNGRKRRQRLCNRFSTWVLSQILCN